MPDFLRQKAWEYCDRSYLARRESNRAIYSLHEDICWIIFPGSNSLRDWISNFCLFRLDEPWQETGIFIHSGFYNLAVKEYEKIASQYKRDCHFFNRFKKIVLTGHSLGGAVAVIVAEFLNYYHGLDCTVISFGAPATGNEIWQKVCDRRITEHSRYVNPFDPVPRILSPKFDYFHSGQEIVNRDQNIFLGHDLKDYRSKVGSKF